MSLSPFTLLIQRTHPVSQPEQPESTIFAARCYDSAAYAVMRCLCVRPSVAFVDSVKTNKRIFKIFSPLGSHTIIVLRTKRHSNIPTGNPSNGGVECRWDR